MDPVLRHLISQTQLIFSSLLRKVEFITRILNIPDFKELILYVRVELFENKMFSPRALFRNAKYLLTAEKLNKLPT